MSMKFSPPMMLTNRMAIVDRDLQIALERVSAWPLYYLNDKT
jgi:hypothetical protein